MQNRIVMIVDDDEDDVELFREALQVIDQKAECYWATDGVEALNLLQKNIKRLPDFIFLDVNMPKMDGMQCLVRLKNHAVLRHIPVVMYTTATNLDYSHLREMGALSVIVKPSDFKEICRVLASAISE